jgi:hypothetical protein
MLSRCHAFNEEQNMLEFSRRIGLPRRKPRVRTAASTVRRHLEPLESRDVPALLAPTGLVATGISASAISLTWNASTDPNVTGYDVYAVTSVGGGGGKGGGHPGHLVYTLVASSTVSRRRSLMDITLVK